MHKPSIIMGISENRLSRTPFDSVTMFDSSFKKPVKHLAQFVEIPMFREVVEEQEVPEAGRESAWHHLCSILSMV